MTYFLYKLISPRTPFPQDITSMEMKIMKEHVVHWKELTDKKIVSPLRARRRSKRNVRFGDR